MSQPFESLIWGIAFSFLHIFTVIVALKYLIKIAPVFIHAASALIGLILLCLVCEMVELQFWIAFSVLAFCTSSYLFVFGAVYKSLTLRILCATQSRGGLISMDQLDSTVTIPTFTARVSLLTQMGNVTAAKDHYFLTQKGIKTANFFSVIRRVFRVDTKAVYHNTQVDSKFGHTRLD